MRAIEARTVLLHLPFLGWFLGLRHALGQGRAGFEPYSVTFLLAMPFVGWFVALFLLLAPWTTMLALSRWP